MDLLPALLLTPTPFLSTLTESISMRLAARPKITRSQLLVLVLRTVSSTGVFVTPGAPIGVSKVSSRSLEALITSALRATAPGPFP